MKCERCGKTMSEETLFTSVEYHCKNCTEDGWQSIDEIISMLSPMDFPIKLKFKDGSGKEGGVFVGDMDYFKRCPKDRKFKVQGLYDPYLGVQKGMNQDEVIQAIYGYSIDPDDDGC